VTSPQAAHRARAIADELLADIDLAGSRFRSDSELSRLNEAGGEPVKISPTFADLLAAALRAARLTGGTPTGLVSRAGQARAGQSPLKPMESSICLTGSRVSP